MKLSSRLVCLALIFCLSGIRIITAQIPDDSDQQTRRKSKKRKKDEDPITQVLPLPKDLPNAVTAETARLSYFVSPLSAKGLLTAQTRDALKYLMNETRHSTIVKLRAFVAGSGDTRRIRTLTSEIFTEKKLPLPALTTIQVGSLGLEGAQVAIQATAVERSDINPNGIAFLSGQSGKTYQEALGKVRAALDAAGTSEVLSVTCFVSSLEDKRPEQVFEGFGASHGSMLAVQMRREPSPTAAECEAVARLRAAPPRPVTFLNPETLPKSANYSHAVLVSSPKIVFTGMQLSFEGSDPKLAFERLGRTLESQGAGYHGVVYLHFYLRNLVPLDQIRTERNSHLDMTHPPASTLLPFEGLASPDANFGIEAVAIPQN